MPVSSMDSYNFLTCLGHHVGLKRMLQVGNLGQGEETPKSWLYFPRLLSLVLESSNEDVAG